MSFYYGVIAAGVVLGLYQVYKPYKRLNEYILKYPELTKSDIQLQMTKHRNTKDLEASLQLLSDQLKTPPTYTFYKDPMHRQIEFEKRKVWMVKNARQQFLNKETSFYFYSITLNNSSFFCRVVKGT